jgi:SAM-dependent methyltransferase
MSNTTAAATYAINEVNDERQRLLAEALNPLTIPILERIPSASIHRILDIGCGQGNTTRMLAAQFPQAEVVGLEYDSALVAHAQARPENRSGVSFQQGDANQLPFPDAGFDLIFTRYLLVHMTDPARVAQEILRCLRPSGYAVSFEPDCSIQFSHPEHPVFDHITRLFTGCFPRPRVGRELYSLYKSAGAGQIDTGALIGVDTSNYLVKRIYQLTIDAMEGPALGRGLYNAAEYGEVKQLASSLFEGYHTVFKLPDMWVIARPNGL